MSRVTTVHFLALKGQESDACRLLDEIVALACVVGTSRSRGVALGRRREVTGVLEQVCPYGLKPVGVVQLKPLEERQA